MFLDAATGFPGCMHDANLMFLDAATGFPGCMHDATYRSISHG